MISSKTNIEKWQKRGKGGQKRREIGNQPLRSIRPVCETLGYSSHMSSGGLDPELDLCYKPVSLDTK